MSHQLKLTSPRVILQLLLVVVVIPCLPLLLSGRWGWWEAWAYAAIGSVGFILSRVLATRRHPDLLAERARFLQQADAKAWDKLLAPVVALGGGVIPLVAGLEALWGAPSAFNSWVKTLTLVSLLAGYALGSYALIENRFFSGMVRIQTERGHRVVSSGPYRWVRHPGYVGALLAYLATPFFLDSWWALLPAVLIAIVLVIRTAMEDKTLQAELDGYCEYALQVRYRLWPGVW